MVTELKPAEWQLWATTKNWPKEGDSDIFAADVVLINHWPIVNGELAKELEEETT